MFGLTYEVESGDLRYTQGIKMIKPKIAFFDTKPYDRKFFNSENDNFNFEIRYEESRLTSDTVHLAKEANVVCLFVNDTVTDEMVKTLKNSGIKLIALRSAGYNNVDLRSVFKNIHTVRVPAYSPHAVAEHAVALALTLNRKIHRAYSRIKDSNFTITGLLGFDMFGKTAGIIGTGKIGKITASILKGFGMKILLYDVAPDEEYAKKEKMKYVLLEELYGKSDIVSLHAPLSSETHHMINNESLLKMKTGVMLINTGRGALIDAQALISALKTQKVGYAGLDVYEEESQYFFEDFSSSFISDDILARLVTFPNVLITSHQGFFTFEALQNIAHTTLSNIKDYFDGKFLKNEICYKCEKKECLKKLGKRCF